MTAYGNGTLTECDKAQDRGIKRVVHLQDPAGGSSPPVSTTLEEPMKTGSLISRYHRRDGTRTDIFDTVCPECSHQQSTVIGFADTCRGGVTFVNCTDCTEQYRIEYTREEIQKLPRESST